MIDSTSAPASSSSAVVQAKVVIARQRPPSRTPRALVALASANTCADPVSLPSLRSSRMPSWRRPGSHFGSPRRVPEPVDPARSLPPAHSRAARVEAGRRQREGACLKRTRAGCARRPRSLGHRSRSEEGVAGASHARKGVHAGNMESGDHRRAPGPPAGTVSQPDSSEGGEARRRFRGDVDRVMFELPGAGRNPAVDAAGIARGVSADRIGPGHVVLLRVSAVQRPRIEGCGDVAQRAVAAKMGAGGQRSTSGAITSRLAMSATRSATMSPGDTASMIPIAAKLPVRMRTRHGVCEPSETT